MSPDTRGYDAGQWVDGTVDRWQMTLLVDIGCPECGRTGPVRKVDIGVYRCADCDREFTQADLSTG